MKIIELFNSIEGEGKRSGELSTFIRTLGCNLSCPYCFGPNQNGVYPMVTMADTTKKPINEIVVGDELLTLDNNLQLTKTKVVDVMTHDTDKYERIVFPNTSLIVTPEHPFYVEGKWINAKDLRCGDKCIKIHDHEYAAYEIFSEDTKKILLDYTKQVISLYDRICSGNMGYNNGNYREDFENRNYAKLRYMILKGYCTQYVLKDFEGTLVIHHLDENKNNDDISNLVIIPRKLHDKLHARGYNFGKANKYMRTVPVLAHTKSYGDDKCYQLGSKSKKFVNLSCYPYNTFLVEDIYVHNCDTKYSWKVDKDTMELSVDEIFKMVENIGCRNITITGGEPLICKGIDKLVDVLLDNFYQVNIETNGTIDPYSVLSSGSLVDDGLFFTMDYKTITSGYNNQMNIDAFKHLQYKDVVKCVVGTREDILDSVRFINNIYEYTNKRNMPSLYLSPIFGMIEPKEIVEIMKELNLSDWKLQLQIHKYIYPVDARGV